MYARVDLRPLASREIVRRVLAAHALLQDAAAILEARARDEEAAGALARAYDEGRAPAWLTAHLLGCVRAGYDTARAILLRGERSLSESYAGVAMARIDPTRARDDLLVIVRDAPQLRVREGAAYGLGALDASVVAVPAVVDAARRGLIRCTCAAYVVQPACASEELIAWLSSDDVFLRRLAVEVVFFRSARETGIGAPPLASAARTALASGAVRLAPSTRRMLEERIARVLDP